MMQKRAVTIAIGAIAVVGIGAIAATQIATAATSVSELAQETHFHGLAVSPADPDQVYLATHHGVFLVGRDGRAERISENRNDYMGFSPHPSDPNVLYASGHPEGGGNLGVIVSRDGGRTWSQIATGVNGPVDFHQMDVSPADPGVIYGVHGALQRSTDGGRTWAAVAQAPDGIIDLAASAQNAETLYAGTQRGLLVSNDAGKTWRQAHPAQGPVTMVEVTREGRIYAFAPGTGLIGANEKDMAWEQLGGPFSGKYVLHLAAAPSEPERLYAVSMDARTKAGAIHVSGDGGRNWARLDAME